MLQHLLSSRSVLGAPLQDLHQEVTENFGFLWFEEVAVDEDPFEIECPQVMDSPEVILSVLGIEHEIVLEHGALLGELLGHRAE